MSLQCSKGSRPLSSRALKTICPFVYPIGPGLWPAVWMLPANAIGSATPTYGGWPTSGEIDILESKGQSPDLVQGSLHTGTDSGHLDNQTQTFALSGKQPAGFSTGDWH